MAPDWDQQAWSDPIQQRRELLRALQAELHDLSQPLTALLCMLEIGRISGSETELREAVEGGMEETRRIFAILKRMRRCLRDEERALASDWLSPLDLEQMWQREN